MSFGVPVITEDIPYYVCSILCISIRILIRALVESVEFIGYIPSSLYNLYPKDGVIKTNIGKYLREW